MRTLTTESTAVLMPFKSQEVQDLGGVYYGINAVSHNLIICNRGNLLNGNGFILACPAPENPWRPSRNFLAGALHRP